MSISHFLMFYGAPDALLLLVAVVFWVATLHTFATIRQILISTTLLAIGTTTIGLILSTTVIIL